MDVQRTQYSAEPEKFLTILNQNHKDLFHFTFNIGIRKNNISVKTYIIQNITMERRLNKY